MKLYKKDYNNQYHPFLINAMFNLCDIIAKRNFIPYGKIVWSVVKQYTNVNHSCPFTVTEQSANISEISFYSFYTGSFNCA